MCFGSKAWVLFDWEQCQPKVELIGLNEAKHCDAGVPVFAHRRQPSARIHVERTVASSCAMGARSSHCASPSALAMRRSTASVVPSTRVAGVWNFRVVTCPHLDDARMEAINASELAVSWCITTR